MGHELSGMLFPWERSAFGDRTEKLKWWQKAYWIGFACAPPTLRCGVCSPLTRRPRQVRDELLGGREKLQQGHYREVARQ